MHTVQLTTIKLSIQKLSTPRHNLDHQRQYFALLAKWFPSQPLGPQVVSAFPLLS